MVEESKEEKIREADEVAKKNEKTKAKIKSFIVEQKKNKKQTCRED